MTFDLTPRLFFTQSLFAMISVASVLVAGVLVAPNAHANDHVSTLASSRFSCENGVKVYRDGSTQAYINHARQIAPSIQQSRAAKNAINHTAINVANDGLIKSAYQEGFKDGAQTSSDHSHRATNQRQRYGRRYTTYLPGGQFGSRHLRRHIRSRFVRR